MADYKEKYLRAVKALSEVEREGDEKLGSLYQGLLAVLNELKGRHKEIDKVIVSLPKKLASSGVLPIPDLVRVKELIVSYLPKDDAVGFAPLVLGELLGALALADELKVDVERLRKALKKAKVLKDYTAISDKLAKLVRKNLVTPALNSQSGSVSDIKRSINSQLELFEKGDAGLAAAVDLALLRKSLKQVESLYDLESFYTEFFDSLNQGLLQKDDFIVELSGLIETVVDQLTELSTDLKEESINRDKARKDRWRLTELMGGEIKTLRDSLVKEDSLVVLKTKLTEKLENLGEAISQFSTLETNRADQAKSHTDRMGSQLKAVEIELVQLKSSLIEAQEQALVDPLTGVANRRAFNERMSIEYLRWQRKNEPLVLAILDIDHFKKINDNYGHPVGDKVLRSVSQLIDQQVRGSDFFGRIGGEEFAIIFVGSSIDNALKRLNQFRKSVETCKFGVKGKRVVVTLSAGCASFEAGDEVDSVYEKADSALMKAKKTGRNKCLSDQRA